MSSKLKASEEVMILHVVIVLKKTVQSPFIRDKTVHCDTFREPYFEMPIHLGRFKSFIMCHPP